MLYPFPYILLFPFRGCFVAVTARLPFLLLSIRPLQFLDASLCTRRPGIKHPCAPFARDADSRKGI